MSGDNSFLPDQMRARLTILLSISISFLPVSSFAAPQTAKPVVEAALDLYTPAALDQQRYAGVFSYRLRANIEGFLEQADIQQLTRPFRQRANGDADLGTGEGAGLFLVAAANSYDYSDDVQLKTVMERLVKDLIQTQEKDGYLGLYTREARWNAGDMLTHAGVMMGLIAYARVTGDDEALAAADRAARLLVATFGGWHRAPPDTVVVLPAMAELYRSTGQKRYLDFCKSLASTTGALTGGALVSTLRGIGLVDLFRLTADDAYLKAAQTIWQKLLEEHRSLTGTPEGSEHLDTCLTLAWFHLSMNLLRLTGSPVYAASLESTIYNSILPAQDATTGNIDRAVPMVGKKTFTNKVTICTAAEAVALSEIMDAVWGRYGDGVAIISYTPGRASVRLHRRASLQLYAEGNYPASGSVVLHVEPAHDVRFPLRLFVPAWTKSFVAEVGNERFVGQPGEFLIVNREWKRGDRVSITMDMTPAVVADPMDDQRVALRRGPQILALQIGLNARVADTAGLVLSKPAAASLREEEGTNLPVSTMTQIFSITPSVPGDPQKLFFVPFSEATDYRVWLRAARQMNSANRPN